MRHGIGSVVAVAAVLGACCCALERTAHAQDVTPASPDSTALPPGVSVAVVADEADAEAIEARVVSWFREQGTPTRSNRQSTVEPSAFFSAQEPGIRIWVVLETPTTVRVFFAVQDREHAAARYLVRDVALDGGLDEIGLEQVAQVVNLSAMALWAGNAESTRQEVEQKLGVGEASPVPPAPPAPPAPIEPVVSAPPAPVITPGSSERLSVAAGFEYAGRVAGPEGITHGLGAILAVSADQRPLELGARLHAQLVLPREIDHGGVRLDLRGATFGLGATIARKTSERVRITGELGGGVDLVQYGVTSVGDPSLTASPPRLEVRPLGYASFGVRGAFGSVQLGVAALLTVQLLRTHYDVSEGETRTALLTPWLVQPGLGTSITW